MWKIPWISNESQEKVKQEEFIIWFREHQVKLWHNKYNRKLFNSRKNQWMEKRRRTNWSKLIQWASTNLDS